MCLKKYMNFINFILINHKFSNNNFQMKILNWHPKDVFKDGRVVKYKIKDKTFSIMYQVMLI